LVASFPSVDHRPEFFDDEYPQHRVRITRPFLLAKTEVTVGQFRQFARAANYRTEAEADGEGGWGYNATSGKCEGRVPIFTWQNPGYPQTDDFPVVNVSYNDALAFCHWLSGTEQRVYRLPTEAEWEYANRAGSGALYATGNTPETLRGSARILDVSRHRDFGHVQELAIEPQDPSAFPLAVGSLQPNRLGLHDMHGNVWEWVADWYGEDYYAQSPANDPRGPNEGEVRVRRGGGWNSFPIWARSSFRNWNTPTSRCLNLGFRVAASID
jgi:formylglycine-generating enzyme required for sulfatase activity